ncbi:disulfide bond formation protein B [Vreelandella populi]|uniref:Disulfide bond formation protein B n=1 Tax=Vreelandella populi TaxID=2498858 RepID=A0A433LBW0_9GAMM|nr:disulfide bond formation protein B [Halomonas populi]RUR42341.1 disulfide bond formation protein B [Halomonas populi]RUR46053.1 disulfide bond formation protein B [Halomonas populi]
MNQAALRPVALAGLAFCVLMMAVALGLEHIGGFEPCPLCVFQRVAVIAAGVIFAVAAIHNPGGKVGAGIYGVLGLAAVGTGAFIAGRHVWLQSLPADQVPSCGPGLDYMMDVLPMRDVISMVLNSSGECAEIDFTLLGFSLPAWTLLGFAILALVPLRMVWLAIKR